MKEIEQTFEKLDKQLLLMVKMGMTDETSTLSIDLTTKELEYILNTLSSNQSSLDLK